jgi:hypothetical protein
MACCRGGGSNRRRYQMCPGTFVLHALKVAVRRGRTALPCTHQESSPDTRCSLSCASYLAGEYFAQVPLTGDEQVIEALAV